jgi:GT2 family glycosyltransferase
MTLELSVIVPLHRLTPEARQCLAVTATLPGVRHEVLAVCDTVPDDMPEGVRVITTGSAVDTSPAEKRDAALPHAVGDIVAFLDDDAYPAADWIVKALDRFAAEPDLAALGGPGITPPNSSYARRLGGAFYTSRLGSGSLRHRFVAVGPRIDVNDWPAYNFFVRRDALDKVGGWASRFYGGEDTKLCLALREAGLRIGYDPEVVVYHHRRPVVRPLARQVGNVGRHRGWFVRRFPETSRRPIYFAPSALLLAAPLALVWSLRSQHRRRFMGGAVALGWAGVTAVGRADGDEPEVALALPFALAVGHGAYGLGFLRGLLLTDEIDSM